MSQIDLSTLEFWAKTTTDGSPGISVLHHTMNVGFVAARLAEQVPRLLEQFHLQPNVVALLAALHDIGKISPGFQMKCPAWLDRNGLRDHSITFGWSSHESNHSRVSQFTVQRWLADLSLPRKTANVLAAAVAAHHGRIICSPADRGMKSDPPRGLVEGDSWEAKRRETADALMRILLPDPELLVRLRMDMSAPEIWWLAGLTSVADWIGSDETFFPVDKGLESNVSCARAAEALERIGFTQFRVLLDIDFEELFGFAPNDLQAQALDAIRSPGIYVIEAPMGMGKTEAALACAYRMIGAGMANGIYFALPTQATSNRIYLRLKNFVEKICPQTTSTRLIHANSWLLPKINPPMPTATLPDSEDARVGRDWFASTKRALLAPFGVGTVDQALLSVVAAKHFFVRRFALAGKVVILDEIHSYDIYTGTLIRHLCKVLEELGCTVILLSATLTPERRNELLNGGVTEHPDESLEAYPLISGRTADGFFTHYPIEVPRAKTVHLKFGEEEKLRHQAWTAASNGACVLWICDTVDSAQRVYQGFKAWADHEKQSPALGLLHARFPLYRRESLENQWMEALGKEGGVKGKRPKGCILVSTQVVEQSVDLDADLMISELAPTDMLLQRMGRLWRHPRGNRPTERPEFWIVAESNSLDGLKRSSPTRIKKILGSKAKVYHPYVLLRSLDIWSLRNQISLPDEIRGALKATYEDRGEDEPEGWATLCDDLACDRMTLRSVALMASNIWQAALNDEEGVQTRINTYEQVSLLLADQIAKDMAVMLNGEEARLNTDRFNLQAARALHRNLVRVPKSLFDDFTTTEQTKRYVRGDQILVSVEKNGLIQAKGLKAEISLRWHPDIGVLISRGDEGERPDEPCN